MDQTANNSIILAYDGYGTDEYCAKKGKESIKPYLGNRSVQLVSADASYFVPKNLKNAQAVVIFGGDAAKMRSAFKEAGMGYLRTFVQEGGSYVGFCAGAYLAGRYSYQSREIDYGANLISSKLVGPTFSIGDAREFTAATARAALIIDEVNKEESYYAFWNGGGYYPSFNSGSERPIAWFQESFDQVAVLYSREKLGRVVTCNVHPEIQLTSSEIEEIFPAINNKKELLASVPRQKALLSRICDYTGLSDQKVNLF